MAHGLLFKRHTSDKYKQEHQLSPQKTEPSLTTAKLQECDKTFRAAGSNAVLDGLVIRLRRTAPMIDSAVNNQTGRSEWAIRIGDQNGPSERSDFVDLLDQLQGRRLSAKPGLYAVRNKA